MKVNRRRSQSNGRLTGSTSVKVFSGVTAGNRRVREGSYILTNFKRRQVERDGFCNSIDQENLRKYFSAKIDIIVVMISRKKLLRKSKILKQTNNSKVLDGKKNSEWII